MFESQQEVEVATESGFGFASAPLFKPHIRQVQGPLAQYLTALIAMEVAPLPPTELFIVPHESVLLTVHLGPRASSFECGDARGMSVALTALRETLGVSHPPGNCVTLFAVLTPLGAIALLRGRDLQGVPRVREPLASVLDLQTTLQLEACLRMYSSIEGKLDCFGKWIEQRVLAPRALGQAAHRTARVAMQILARPHLPIDEIARAEHVSSRQLERDFRRWLAVSPKRVAQTARLQQAARLAHRGLSLAQVASEARFADQAHMSRSIHQLTGRTPRQLFAPARHPMALAFRQVTGGGLVYA
ncbi:MAG: Transcriptional regulator, AraC family [Pseudomonadota bacterium]